MFSDAQEPNCGPNKVNKSNKEWTVSKTKNHQYDIQKSEYVNYRLTNDYLSNSLLYNAQILATSKTVMLLKKNQQS